MNHWLEMISDPQLNPDLTGTATEPPCPGCLFWFPLRRFSSEGLFDGVVCCHSHDQERDFSCYRPREGRERRP